MQARKSHMPPPVAKGLTKEPYMPSILLAEDDSSMRQFLKRSLEKGGHTVLSVENGEDALPHLQSGGFDLLLTDIVMPGIDGIELARMASEIAPDMRVMFITGFAAVVLGRRDELPNDVKILSKPFHLKELVQEVDRVLAA